MQPTPEDEVPETPDADNDERVAHRRRGSNTRRAAKPPDPPELDASHDDQDESADVERDDNRAAVSDDDDDNDAGAATEADDDIDIDNNDDDDGNDGNDGDYGDYGDADNDDVEEGDVDGEDEDEDENAADDDSDNHDDDDDDDDDEEFKPAKVQDTSDSPPPRKITRKGAADVSERAQKTRTTKWSSDEVEVYKHTLRDHGKDFDRVVDALGGSKSHSQVGGFWKVHSGPRSKHKLSSFVKEGGKPDKSSRGRDKGRSSASGVRADADGRRGKGAQTVRELGDWWIKISASGGVQVRTPPFLCVCV